MLLLPHLPDWSLSLGVLLNLVLWFFSNNNRLTKFSLALFFVVDLGGSQHSYFNGALFCLCERICSWRIGSEGLVSFWLVLTSVSKSPSSAFLRDRWVLFLSFLSLQRFWTSSFKFDLPEFCYTLFCADRSSFILSLRLYKLLSSLLVSFYYREVGKCRPLVLYIQLGVLHVNF